MKLTIILCNLLVTVSHGEYNYALNKPTTALDGRRSTRLAVDGNLNADYRRGSCYQGASYPNPWWQVDLAVNVLVTRVKVQNRKDCCGNRVRDFSIDLFDENPSLNQEAPSKHCLFYKGTFPTAGVLVNLNCIQPVGGQFLRLTINSSSMMMNLCELQLFGKSLPFSSCSTLVLQKGQRLSSPSIQTLGPEFDSRAVCAAECDSRRSCKGFNIKYQATVACELFDISARSAADENWDAYLINRCLKECE